MRKPLRTLTVLTMLLMIILCVTASAIAEFRVAGRVVDDSGQGVAGARFSVLRMDARRTWQLEVTAETNTDENGRFSLTDGERKVGLPYSLYAARHPAYGLAWTVDMVALMEGRDPVDLRMVLPKRGSVRGKVTDTEGNPVEGAVVSAGITLPEGAVDEEVRFLPPCEALLKGISSADGAFVLDGLPSNAWVILRVTHPDYAVALEGTPEAMLGTPAGNISAGADDVTVRLEPGATVEGEIILEQTGQPAKGAVLQAVPLIEDFATCNLLTPAKVATDANGRYVLRGLRAGTQSIIVSHPEGIAASKVIEVLTGARMTDQNVKLERGVLVSGTIIDAGSGEPISRVELNVLRPDTRPRTSLQVEVGAGGAFSFRQPPGEVLLHCIGRTGWQVTKRLTLLEGEDQTDVDILLDDRQSREQREARTLVNKEGLELDVLAWVNAEVATLESFRGQVVVLAFWDCSDEACEPMVPLLNGLLEEYSENGVAVVSVHSAGADRDALGEFIGANSIAFHVALDKPAKLRKGGTFEKYNVSEVPAVFIIDAEGKVRYQDIPLAAVEEAVKQLLDEQ
jgi:peroxiredoxin